MAAKIALLAIGLALLSAPCLAAVSLQAYDDLLNKAQVLCLASSGKSPLSRPHYRRRCRRRCRRPLTARVGTPHAG